MARLACRRTQLLACALLLAAAPTPAAEPLELRVKAAFVFNLARFASWPPERLPQPASAIDLCVLDDPAFLAAARETIDGKTIGSHPMRVRSVGSTAELPQCHVVYVGTDRDAGPALAAAAGHGVLTVHNDAAPSRDGVVRFFIEDRRVRFEINAAAAAREQLQLSSKLLSLARVVSL